MADEGQGADEGFADRERAEQNLAQIRSAVPAVEVDAVAEAAAGSFAPDRALDNFERFFSGMGEEDGRRLSGVQSLIFYERLAAAFSGSQYLTNLLLHRPSLAIPLADSAYLESRQPSELLLLAARRETLSADTHPGRLAGLRRFRHAAFLRIGLRDLLGCAPVPEILREISDVADASLQMAYETCLQEARRKYGDPIVLLPDGARESNGFAIIGLGKLGGQELNFSSDIDILYVFSSDQGETTGMSEEGSVQVRTVSNPEFFTALSKMITAALQEETEEGRVFRVDLRLRPEGSQGAICYSLRSHEVYYESCGENWERQALIKARCCAGDTAVGEAFCAMVRRFTFRKSLDYELIEEIRQNKERIDRAIAERGQDRENVKLGYGGIREVEFAVQTFQMIYGGQDPELQSRNTLDVLQAIGRKNILPSEELEGLTGAYLFLRALENRIQLANDRQTYRLPSDPLELVILARQMGFSGSAGRTPADVLKAAYARHQHAVRRVYDNLFYDEDEDQEPTIVFLKENESSLTQHLESLGFTDSVQAFRLLLQLREGKAGVRATTASRKQFDRLSPLLVPAMAHSPDPDLALVNFVDFVEVMGAREHLYEMLNGSTQLTELLVQLFGSSRFLAQRLLRYPGDIDQLLNPRVWQQRLTRDEHLAALRAAVVSVETLENRKAELRKYKRSAELHIAMRSLANADGLDQLFEDLTALADAYLQVSLDMAEDALRPVWGIPDFRDTLGRHHRVDMVVLGAGKLGGRELDFGSDLDVILVYDKEGETFAGATDAPPPRAGKTNFEYFSALYQEYRAIVSEATAAGTGFEIDLRLRPEGTNGPFICPLDLFGRYYYHRAELWEIQMLTKVRHCAGDPGLAEKIQRIIRSVQYGRTFTADDIRAIAAMRRRLESELARETEGRKDVKRGYGGVVDIEFVAQLLQLLYGHHYTTLWATGSIETLRAARRLQLLSSADADALMDSYRFLRRIEHALRIVDDRSIHSFEDTAAGFTHIARRLGYLQGAEDGAARLAADYAEHTQRVRDIFTRVFDGEARRREKTADSE